MLCPYEQGTWWTRDAALDNIGAPQCTGHFVPGAKPHGGNEVQRWVM